MSSLIVEVCKVDNIIKHPNADKLSIVTIKGWNCIVGLDQYKQGDLIVFVPPDSVIPQNLIEKYQLTYLKKDGRVTSTRLRGLLSQGLVLDLPEGKWKEGDDLSKVLNISKWEVPEAPVIKGANQTPKKNLNANFNKYTDIENIKNYNNVFKEGDLVVITEKIHGTNARYGNLEISINKNQPIWLRIKAWFKEFVLKQTHEFVYGSHNVQLKSNNGKNNFYGDDVWGRMGKAYSMKEIIPPDYTVYAEIYGEGIQDLTYGVKGVTLAVYDIKYKDKYMDWGDVIDFCNKNNLPTVPILYGGPFCYSMIDEYTSGNSKILPSQMREGCVIKLLKEGNDPHIGRKILKSINPVYILRKNGTEFK
jgi:RNA ligase (TIGR02306 family)